MYFKKIIDKIMDNSFVRKNREIILLLSDLTLILFSYLIAILVKYNFSSLFFAAYFHNFTYLLPMIILVNSIFLIVFKIHKTLWEHFGLREVSNITYAMVLSTIVLIILSFIMSFGLVTMSIIIIAQVFSLFLILNTRYIYRTYRDVKLSYKYDDKTKRVVIIGAGDAGNFLLREIRQNPSIKVNIVGFIDDYKVGKIVNGLKVLGTTKDIKKIKEKYNISAAYIAIPSLKISRRKAIIEKCHNAGLDIKIMKKATYLLSSENDNKLPIEDVSIDDLLGRGEVKFDTNEISQYLYNQTIIVTGAGGSIGSELCRQIIQFNPKKIILIDINENSLYMLENELRINNETEKIRNIQHELLVLSITNRKEIFDLFKKEKPDVVFHAAARKHVPLMETRPQEAFENNVIGTKNVIEAAIESDVKYFVLISTDKAVNPTNVMGASKRLTEMLIQLKGKDSYTKMAAVRFGNVLGSNGSVIPIFNEQIKKGGPLTLTSKKIERYFMSIPEAAKLVLQAGAYANNGEIFVLDMGKPIKIKDLAEKLIQLSGYKPYEDIDIVEVGLRPGEKMFEELKLDKEETISTANKLIFVNKPMEINEARLKNSMEKIESLIENSASNEDIKKEMFNAIEVGES